MAFTSTDLTNIETAITELATGARVVRASVGGRYIEYGQADLDKLMSLRSIIQSDVNAAAGSGGMLREVALRDPS